MLPDFSTNRFEIKYIVPVRTFPAIKAALADLLAADSYHGDINDGYYNHSIYFDTPDFRFYFQKREGLNERVKVRLRAHKDSPDDRPTKIMLEIKHRLGHVGRKERHPLARAEADSLLTSPGFSGVFDSTDGNVPALYNRLVKQFTLRPQVSVLYHRQAYAMPLYPGVRLTFDKGVRASRQPHLDAPLGSYHYVLEPQIGVVELKYLRTVPSLVLSRIRQLSLTQATFSKYANGMEALFRYIADNHRRDSRAPIDIFAASEVV